MLESLLIKLQAFGPATLLKRDSNTGVFLGILQNSFFHRTPLVADSGIETSFLFVTYTTLKIYKDSMTQT